MGATGKPVRGANPAAQGHDRSGAPASEENFGLSRSRRSIDERPSVVDLRERVGDWESDRVASGGAKPGLHTVVENKTGFALFTKLSSLGAAETTGALAARLSAAPAKFKDTLTTDNSNENSDGKAIEELTGTNCYAANPHHARERGSNENLNGLIRQ